jgi:hypothetical protein
VVFLGPFIQAIVERVSTRSLPSKSFPIQFLSITLPLDAVWSGVLTELSGELQNGLALLTLLLDRGAEVSVTL